MELIAWISFLYFCAAVVQGQSCKREPRCRVSRVHGMKGADCFKKDFREFPQCVQKDVEILDLSVNRIRRIGKNDVRRYPDVKMLYLSDNVIVSIDKEAFDEGADITSLDLSINAISNLPPVIFHLPSLKSLYLGQNMNMNIAEVVEGAQPITSPLVQLDISHIYTEEPGEMPDLGTLHYLKKLNISGNMFLGLNTAKFAGLCALEILDTSNVTGEYDEPCNCWVLNKWLKRRKVKFAPFACRISEEECSDSVPLWELKTYSACREEIDSIVRKSRVLKIVIPCVVIGGLILLAIAFYAIRRRRQRLRKPKRVAPQVQLDNQMLILKPPLNLHNYPKVLPTD